MVSGSSAFARRRFGAFWLVSVASASVLSPDVALSQDASTALEEINVQGAGKGQTGWGPVDGFVASRSLTGTKTDTPIIETPQSISVITADQMETQGVQSIGSALRYTAGVGGETNGQDTRGFGWQIRGFNVSDESFYKDGLRFTGTDYTSFLTLEPYGAERIEILRGPASVLYGQNSPAGIVNYVSKRPKETPFGEISVSGGTLDTLQGEFDVGGPVTADSSLSYRITGLARNADAGVDFVKDDRFFIAPAVTWKSDDTSLTVLGHYQKDKTGWGIQFLPAEGTVWRRNGRYIPRDRNVGEPDFDKYDVEQAAVGYMFEHAFNEMVTVRQNARYAHLSNLQNSVYGGGYTARDPDLFKRFPDYGKSSIGSFAIDNQAQFKFDTGALAHTLLTGVEYRYADYKDYGAAARVKPIDIFDPVYGAEIGPFEAYQDTRSRQRQTGVYAQEQIKFDRWTLSFGGRRDWSELVTDDRLADARATQNDTAFTAKAGLVYLFDSGLAPYVSYSESFFPSLGTASDGSPLKPEEGVQYEAGVKFQPTGWNSFVTASVFDLTKQNVVRSFGPIVDQTGEIRSRGFEVEAVASLDTGWDVKLAYAYVDIEITKGDVRRNPAKSTEGNHPWGAPKHRFSAWADYEFQTGALKGAELGGGVRVVGSSWGDDYNSFKVPAATVFDAAASYRFDKYKLSVNASNLLDKRYVASCFGADAGCFYAEGRRVLGKLTYTW